MTLKPHPYADQFPMMEGEAFEAFALDVKEKGVLEKIVLLDGMILDGRNRYSASVKYDLPAAHGDAACFRDFDPLTEGDPLEWVISKNIHRRHLTLDQRALVAASLATMQQGERTDIEPSAKLRKVSQDEAAKLLQVSPRSLQSAKVVREHGTPALVELVQKGKVPVHQAEKAARRTPEQQDKVVALANEGKPNAVRTALKQMDRNDREEKLGKKQLALPDKRYGVILCDPEHQFEVWSRATGLDRAADNHYSTTDFRQLMLREIHKIAATDSMLVMWVTDLARGIRLMEAWGFTFKSYRAWVKDIVPVDLDPSLIDTPDKVALLSMLLGVPAADLRGVKLYKEVGQAGTGYWFRDRDELVLIGTRGGFVAPAMGTQPESILFAARPKLEGSGRGRHSAKPLQVHEWIEENWPHLAKIELNARAARPGWDVWGHEAPEAKPPEAAEPAPAEPQPARRRTADEILAVARDKTPRWQTQHAEPLDAMDKDDPYAVAKALVVRERNASPTFLLRMLPRFNLSYEDAFELLARMEREGVVSAPDERTRRQVLTAPEHVPEPSPPPPPPRRSDEIGEIPDFLRRTK